MSFLDAARAVIAADYEARDANPEAYIEFMCEVAPSLRDAIVDLKSAVVEGEKAYMGMLSESDQ